MTLTTEPEKKSKAQMKTKGADNKDKDSYHDGQIQRY